MRGSALETARYRYRTTFRRRRGGYLTVLLLVGLVGGLAMGAVAGARRTQSAFPAYLAATNASELQVGIFPTNPNAPGLYSRAQTEQLARLPQVERVASEPEFFSTPLKADGAPAFPAALNNNEVETVGSVHGEYFDQDGVTVAQGRLADPSRVDEMMATSEAVHLLGWHIGQVLPIGIYTFQQSSLPGFGTPRVRPYLRVNATLVGVVVLNSQVVRDEVDQYPGFVIFTPAYTRKVLAQAAYFPENGLRLVHGSRDVPAVEQEIIHHLPPNNIYTFHVTSVVEGQLERAIKPETIALGVFGAIAALATLLIAGQAIGRQLRSAGEDLEVMRALGADRRMTVVDGFIGIFGAIILGSLLAVAVAFALSPLSPIGLVHQVDPSPGPAFDWPVLVGGLLVLVVGLVAVTVGLAFWQLPHRIRNPRSAATAPPSSAVAAAAAGAGLSLSAVTGVRFALERDTSRNAVPVRSALVGSVLAVVLLVATLTFGSGLGTLVSHPSLYGWNWNYAIEEVNSGKVPPIARAMLNKDQDVAAWTGFSFASIEIDGQTVPALTGNPDSSVTPPILSGHGVEAGNQIVLGAATMAQLHTRIGDTVEVSYGSAKSRETYVPPTRLTVVGTATMPAIGNTGELHPSMGTGALVPDAIKPAAFAQALASQDPNQNGPRIAVIRLRPGVPVATGLASLQRIARAASKVAANDPNSGGGPFAVLPVQQPAEIVNYRSIGATPALLAAGVVVGAVVALGLTLAASTRRRQRDLALLKTLGFTHRQLATTVAWQASVAAVVGVVVGVPLGIVLGRWLWTLFAREIYAVPQPTVPTLQIVLVALGAVVLANVVAAIPGRTAARTPTAILLRAE